MDNFQKYSRLMLLLAGSFFGIILFLALLIFVLRLFSGAVLHIAGFDLFYHYVTIIIPYLLFFGAYYYLYKKINLSKIKAARLFAWVFLVAGCMVCLFAISLSTALFLHIKNDWLKVFEENSQYALIIQLVIIFVIAGTLASGDAKEKDWMERETNI